jgi:uncharacterized membrane protein YgaE (UPF0421/DUF939 family)
MVKKIVLYIFAKRTKEGWEYLQYPDSDAEQIWDRNLKRLKKDKNNLAEALDMKPSEIVILKETTEEV